MLLLALQQSLNEKFENKKNEKKDNRQIKGAKPSSCKSFS